MIRPATLALGIVLSCVMWTGRGEAHKPITSKYTYNEDVFPIFRDKCARCHIADGVGPMSLVTYAESFPWAESLRVELLADQLPPWHSFTLTARELDVVLVWASGGTPQGNAANKPAAVALKNEWPGGSPDLALQMPVEFTLTADTTETTEDFLLATGLATPRALRAVDLLPGTPAIVRDAVIYLKSGAKDGKDPGEVLARWMPGQTAPSMVPNGPLRVPARAALVLRVHYRKTWKHEGTTVSDRSTVGLYFSESATSGRR